MRIGVFGGTFDPPHVGHVAVAEDARKHLGLDRLLFVPAHVSPFKVGEAGITDAELRHRMTEAAIEGRQGLDVDRIELDRDPPSYTVDTLRALAGRTPEAELFLLLGADQWASFGRWKDAAEIAELATIVVLARDGTDPGEIDPGVDVPWRSVDVRRVDVSSTEVRERVREGRSIEGLVPGSVARIIEDHELYRAAPAAHTVRD
jgi:nicotinate-nucleotide adenylyltransferase